MGEIGLAPLDERKKKRKKKGEQRHLDAVSEKNNFEGFQNAIAPHLTNKNAQNSLVNGRDASFLSSLEYADGLALETQRVQKQERNEGESGQVEEEKPATESSPLLVSDKVPSPPLSLYLLVLQFLKNQSFSSTAKRFEREAKKLLCLEKDSYLCKDQETTSRPSSVSSDLGDLFIHFATKSPSVQEARDSRKTSETDAEERSSVPNELDCCVVEAAEQSTVPHLVEEEEGEKRKNAEEGETTWNGWGHEATVWHATLCQATACDDQHDQSGHELLTHQQRKKKKMRLEEHNNEGGIQLQSANSEGLALKQQKKKRKRSSKEPEAAQKSGTLEGVEAEIKGTSRRRAGDDGEDQKESERERNDADSAAGREAERAADLEEDQHEEGGEGKPATFITTHDGANSEGLIIGKRQKPTNHERFRRVDEEKWTASLKSGALQDNSFWKKKSDDFATKAATQLGKVKGKDFRHEKSKKKKTNWKGMGSIPLAINSVAFEDSD